MVRPRARGEIWEGAGQPANLTVAFGVATAGGAVAEQTLRRREQNNPAGKDQGSMKRLMFLMIVVAATTGLAAAAMAQDNGLPSGTVITHDNWQQYRNYMTAGE